MRGKIYVFMSVVLLALIGCNTNEDTALLESQEASQNNIIELIKQSQKTANRSTSAVNSSNVIFETDLMAGQHHVAGSLTIAVDMGNLIITYYTTNGWVLNETHLFAGDKDLIPTTKKGNPKIGKFPYKASHNGVNEFSYTIPISDLSGVRCFAIAAHAVVSKNGSKSETAWGAGTDFDGKSWAMYTSFCGNGEGNTE